MKTNIITDIKAAVKVFTDIRKARKEGAEVVVKQCQQLPFIRSGGFYNTVEGLTLSDLDKKIVSRSQEAFNELPEDVKHLLYFSPKDGERTAMICILRWYIHIKHMHLGMDVPEYGSKGSAGMIEILSAVHNIVSASPKLLAEKYRERKGIYYL